MPSFPQNEVNEINELLHKLLGFGIINLFSNDFIGEQFLNKSTEDSLIDLNNLSDENFIKLYKILNFYYPRWIAYNCILLSNDKYSEYSSNNELLLALTSIIDFLANPNSLRMGWTNRFIAFIKNNLSETEIDQLLNGPMIYKAGQRVQIQNIDEFAKYIYEVRSVVIHYAELTGMHPYNISFDFDDTSNIIKKENIFTMIQPDEFRKLLWKAILKNLNLNLIN
ncbi:MAG: hypothetical protein GF365_00875 [Candidatus Buchananbacteria bacterium]|nr:hypothetical protein [Candidatus Buchananbacteria bacterium]